MKAFEFDHQLIRAYEHFSRSFSAIRAPDLKYEIDAQYDAGKFWPDALLSLNPRFMAGPTVHELVATGDLDDGRPIFSELLSRPAINELRSQVPIRLTDDHRIKLRWHREKVFKRDVLRESKE